MILPPEFLRERRALYAKLSFIAVTSLSGGLESKVLSKSTLDLAFHKNSKHANVAVDFDNITLSEPPVLTGMCADTAIPLISVGTNIPVHPEEATPACPAAPCDANPDPYSESNHSVQSHP